MNTRINRSGHIPANPNNHPDVAAAIAATIGTLVRDLLTEHPDIEFDTIRIQTLNGNTAIVSGRAPGEPFGPAGCSTCHQPAGRPHTDYCHAGGIVGADPRTPIVSGLPTTDATYPADGLLPPLPDSAYPPGAVDLVSHLKTAVEAAHDQVNAASERAHERDRELDDGKGGTWHQTGPEDAHYRTQCAPERCGWNPPDPIGEVDRAEQARLDAIANDGPQPE